MKSIYQTCIPRQAVLDCTADFVVNLSDLPKLDEAEAREFLDANVLTSGMELLLMNAFSRLAGVGSPSGIYKLSESMGGGKTQSMIVAGILARFRQSGRMASLPWFFRCPSSPLADHWSPSSISPAMVQPHLHESADPLGDLRFG